jgi:hypothetical protein
MVTFQLKYILDKYKLNYVIKILFEIILKVKLIIKSLN